MPPHPMHPKDRAAAPPENSARSPPIALPTLRETRLHFPPAETPADDHPLYRWHLRLMLRRDGSRRHPDAKPGQRAPMQTPFQAEPDSEPWITTCNFDASGAPCGVVSRRAARPGGHGNSPRPSALPSHPPDAPSPAPTSRSGSWLFAQSHHCASRLDTQGENATRPLNLALRAPLTVPSETACRRSPTGPSAPARSTSCPALRAT